MKVLTWLLLSIILLFCIFGWNNAHLDSNAIIIAGMILLISLYAELKNFNFFGLFKGEKFSNKELKKLEDEKGLSQEKVDKKKVESNENEPLQLMDNAQGNFLKLVFEIERLLRIYANVLYAPNPPQTENLVKLTKKLHDDGHVTDSGLKQLEAIRWLRNEFVHGKSDQINQATLQTGIEIAASFYQELFQALYGENDG